MIRYVACLAVTLLVGAPLCAGELDREYAAKAAAPAMQKGPADSAKVATVAAPSELDSETPADAHRGGRGGWGGGGRGGWGGGWRGGWGGRGGWGVGWRGGRGWWGGRYGYAYWPGYYYPTYYYPTYYYPTYSYVSSYPGWGVCW